MMKVQNFWDIMPYLEAVTDVSDEVYYFHFLSPTLHAMLDPEDGYNFVSSKRQ
jgi:hypothetical protein